MKDNTAFYIGALIVGIIGAIISSRIAGNKGHSAVGFGILGFFLPLIGIVVALIVKDRNKVTVG